jgi:predicted dehydrogenase
VTKLRWGILGTGTIAHTFVKDLHSSKTGIASAIASRFKASAENAAVELDIPRWYEGYPALLEDPAIDAVYIATPHPIHLEWAVRAAEAGKHILCEKPLGMNTGEAQTIIEAARVHDVFLMEAFMYRGHPQIAKLIELIRAGTIGEIKLIQAVFSFNGGFPVDHRALDPRLGGGGILDVGCYCTSICRLVAGVARGGEIAEPDELMACGYIGKESGVDEYTIASAKFPGGVLAQLSTGVQLEQEEVVRIYGDEGRIVIRSPWLPQRGGREPILEIYRSGDAEPELLCVESDRELYTLEADLVAENLKFRQAPFPAVTWEDTLGNMRMLDRWLQAIGMRYPRYSETGEAQVK